MKNKVVLGGVLFITSILIGYVVFVRLGGNNPVTIQLVNLNPESLVGKTFTGTPQDKRLGEIFQEMEALKGLNPGSFLHTIYEIEPAGKLDTMKVFVGINKSLPLDGVEQRTFDSPTYLIAKIQANRWVMPSPEKIKRELEDYASENKLILSGIFIDKIISDSEVHVIAPIL